MKWQYFHTNSLWSMISQNTSMNFVWRNCHLRKARAMGFIDQLEKVYLDCWIGFFRTDKVKIFSHEFIIPYNFIIQSWISCERIVTWKWSDLVPSRTSRHQLSIAEFFGSRWSDCILYFHYTGYDLSDE